MLDRRVSMDEDRYARRVDAATRRMIKPSARAMDQMGQSTADALNYEAGQRLAGDAALGQRIDTLASGSSSAVTAEAQARQRDDQAEAQARLVGDQSNAAAIQSEATARGQADTALGGRIDTLGATTAAGLNAEATTRQQADTAEATTRAAADAIRTIMFGADGKAVQNPREYAHTLATNASGVAVFYLTDTGLASGNALFTSIRSVQPQVNDGTTIYGFGWTISADMKTLTMTVRKSATPVLSLLGLNILAAPALAPAGTLVNVFVAGV